MMNSLCFGYPVDPGERDDRGFVSERATLGIALLVVLLGSSTSATAQIYRCQVEGKTVFQETPCKGAIGQTNLIKPVEAAPKSPWSGLALGVSAREVERRFSKFGTKKDGEESLRFEEARVAGLVFEGLYSFRAGLLARFGASSTMMTTRVDAKRAYGEIVDDFRKTWGPEQKSELRDDKAMLAGQSEWLVPWGRVSVTITPQSGEHSGILINFFAK